MNEIRLLTALELRSLFGINKFRHEKDKKARRRYIILCVAFVYLILIAEAYVCGLVYGLCSLGVGSVVPAYLVFISSLLVFVFGLFKAGNGIFGRHGYDIISSMPIKTSSVVASRFLFMYLQYFALTLLIMIPGVSVYGVLMRPSALFYIVAVLCSMLIPAIPLITAVLIGTLIMLASSKMKHKSLVQTVLMLSVVLAILIASFGLQGMTNDFSPEALASLAATFEKLFSSIYLPSIWLQNAMLGESYLEFWLFLLVSAALCVVCMMLCTRIFGSIISGLSASGASGGYKAEKLKRGGALKALYIRELKRYFSSSIYVTNTIIGPILGAVSAVALCIVEFDKIYTVIPQSIPVTAILPFVVSAVFCMMTTTSCSISMEGKHFWVVRSVPISSKSLFDAKILLNLSIMLPFYIIMQVCLIIAAKPNLIEVLFIILIPAFLMVFSTVIGITVNLKFHSFDWTKDEQVVKQSASVMLGGFSGALLSILLAVAVGISPVKYVTLIRVIVCAVLAFTTFILYRSNNKAKLEKL